MSSTCIKIQDPTKHEGTVNEQGGQAFDSFTPLESFPRMPLRLLTALDAAKTGFLHFKVIIVAGMGLFTDAYDLFCITPITLIMGRVYYNEPRPIGGVFYEEPSLPILVKSIMLAVALLGAAIGQLVFGRLGDTVGRRRMYGLALLIMVFSSIGCGFSVCRMRTCVLVSLGLFRFLLGLGIGGDYPLSATIMSEFANKMKRGALIAAVFSMQGFGILAASTVTMIVCKIFEAGWPISETESTPNQADIAWRLILMLGAIPAALTFYWRIMTPETARYTALVERNVHQATMDMKKVLEFSMDELVEDEPLLESAPQYPLFSKQFFRRHGRDLFSCASSWFLVDIFFYSSNLFQPSLYKHETVRKSTFEQVFEVAKDQAITIAWSTIPAYWFTVVFIDRIGRVRIQTMGFILLTMVYLAMGLPFNSYWRSHMGKGFTTLYGLTFFFSNFGPNTTTFIVPAELFPARFRSTCHGISGAAGKLGASIGSIGFWWALHKPNQDSCDETCKHVTPGKDCYCFPVAFQLALLTLAGVCAMGAVVSFLFTPETKGRSLEENEKDDEPSQLSLCRCLTGDGKQRL